VPPVNGGSSRVVVPSGDVYAQIQVSQKRTKLPDLPVEREPSPEPSDTYATLNNDDPIGNDDVDGECLLKYHRLQIRRCVRKV
jgi:hypothetical protein